MKRPMLISAVFGSILIILSLYYRKTVLILLAGLILLFISSFYNKWKARTVISICFMILIVLSVIRTYSVIDFLDACSGERFSENFIVTSAPKISGKYTYLKVKSDEGKYIPKGIKIGLYTFDNKIRLNMGDRIKATIKLQSLKNSVYNKTNYADGVYAKAKIIKVNKKYTSDPFYSRISSIREYIVSTVSKNVSYESAATLLGITIGDKDLFSEEFSKNVRTVGVSHVMVVSGMHLAIIMGAIYALIDRLFYNRYIRFLITFVVLIFICGICGFTVSVIRAAIMYLLVSLSILIKRDNDSVNTLGTAAVIIFLFSPFTLFSISFQLSVLATFGIVVLAPFICKKIHIRNKILSALMYIVSGTLSATVMTLPILIYDFGLFSVVGVASNLLISYAVTAVLLLNSVALIINGVWILYPVSRFVFALADFGCKYINMVINSLAKLPFASFEVGKTAFWISVTVLCIAFAVMYTCKRREYLLKLKEMNEKIIAETKGRKKNAGSA